MLFSFNDIMPSNMLPIWSAIVLSGLLIIGYSIIIFKWYFQRKVAQSLANSSIYRIKIIAFCDAILCYLIMTTNLTWGIYDIALLSLNLYTWFYLFKMRGISLINARLAQIDVLEKTAQKYQEIASFLPLVIWTATQDGVIDFINEQWNRYGNDGSWLNAIEPLEKQKVADWWERIIAERESISKEIRLVTKYGYRTFILTASPLISGSAVRWLGALADIEAQKLLAQEKEYQAQQRIFFLNSLSHDLRAPLNCVSLNANLLKCANADELEEIADSILQNVGSATNMVNHLLEYAKAEATDNAKDKIYPSALLQQICKRFQPVAEKKGIFLRINDRNDTLIVTDKQKLERILNNLIDNAIKFTHRGGVTIGVDTNGEKTCISVKDTGIGIPDDAVNKIFDEFYQCETRDKSKGFGMGLAICRSLAKQIDAEIKIAKTGFDGSCFELCLHSN